MFRGIQKIKIVQKHILKNTDMNSDLDSSNALEKSNLETLLFGFVAFHRTIWKDRIRTDNGTELSMLNNSFPWTYSYINFLFYYSFINKLFSFFVQEERNAVWEKIHENKHLIKKFSSQLKDTETFLQVFFSWKMT